MNASMDKTRIVLFMGFEIFSLNIPAASWSKELIKNVNLGQSELIGNLFMAGVGRLC